MLWTCCKRHRHFAGDFHPRYRFSSFPSSTFPIAITFPSHSHHVPKPTFSRLVFPVIFPDAPCMVYLPTFGVNVDESCRYGCSIIHQHLPQMDIISINSIWYSQTSSIIFPCGNSPPRAVRLRTPASLRSRSTCCRADLSWSPMVLGACPWL